MRADAGAMIERFGVTPHRGHRRGARGRAERRHDRPGHRRLVRHRPRDRRALGRPRARRRRQLPRRRRRGRGDRRGLVHRGRRRRRTWSRPTSARRTGWPPLVGGRPRRSPTPSTSTCTALRSPSPGSALEIDPARLAQAIAVNGTSLVPLTQGLLPVLQRGSSLVYVSSRGARSYVPSYVALGPTKSLGEALIRYLAVELAPRGVRANTVAAGPLDTPAFRTMFGDQAQARLDGAAAANPSGRGLAMADVRRRPSSGSPRPAAAMVQGQTRDGRRRHLALNRRRPLDTKRPRLLTLWSHAAPDERPGGDRPTHDPRPQSSDRRTAAAWSAGVRCTAAATRWPSPRPRCPACRGEVEPADFGPDGHGVELDGRADPGPRPRPALRAGLRRPRRRPARPGPRRDRSWPTTSRRRSGAGCASSPPSPDGDVRVEVL